MKYSSIILLLLSYFFFGCMSKPEVLPLKATHPASAEGEEGFIDFSSLRIIKSHSEERVQESNSSIEIENHYEHRARKGHEKATGEK